MANERVSVFGEIGLYLSAEHLIQTNAPILSDSKAAHILTVADYNTHSFSTILCYLLDTSVFNKKEV